MLNDTPYYYKKNLQGDIIGILDSNLQIVTKYTYDAWGNFRIYCYNGTKFIDMTEESSYTDTDATEIALSNRYIAIKNPFRYRGYYYDVETNLYYLNSRYYDPETGRFITIDDISILSETQNMFNGLNLYAYCGNNPIMYADENGYFFGLLITSLIIGALFGGAVKGYTAYKEGVRGWNLFGAILGGAIFGAAMGAVTALGGAAGLVVGGVASTVTTLTVGQLFATSLAVGLFAGWTSYTVENVIRTDTDWNLAGFAMSGISSMVKTLFTFSTSMAGGYLGLFDKLIINPALKGAKTIDMNITYAMAKVMFLDRRFALSPVSEFVYKLFGISGVAGGTRWFIDYLFGT